jgi:hypothetical protein
MTGETTTVSIKVCEENGQLFYVGKLKQEPSQVLKIRAWKLDNHKYQADNAGLAHLKPY